MAGLHGVVEYFPKAIQSCNIVSMTDNLVKKAEELGSDRIGDGRIKIPDKYN